MKCIKKTIRYFLSILLLCGALATSACAPQGDGGDALYNHIYKNGWTQMPAPQPGERAFSDVTRAALL